MQKLFLRPLLFLSLVFLCFRTVHAFPPVELLEVLPVVSLPNSIHHGLLLKIAPISNPSLLRFKVELSKDEGTNWFLYDDQLRPYDHRYIILPYRGKNYALATGQDYRVRLCADYGSEVQCTTSDTFSLPTVLARDPQDSQDADDDILATLQEYNLGTDPRNPDSDQDQMADPFEVARNLDPNFTQLPLLSINESSYDFGSGIPSGYPNSQHHIFTITNRGTRALRISNGIFSGSQPNQFQYFNQALEIVEVPPNQSRAVAVDFLPNALGRLTAGLDVLSDDIAHFPTSISLAGVGSHIAHLKVESESRLSFASTRVGENSSPKTVVVSNPDSDRSLAVSVFVDHTLNFLAIPNRFTLSPNGKQDVQVIFAPEWAGSYEGLLEVRAGNAADKNHVQIPLVAEATGALPRMRLGATNINFGSNAVGTESRRELVLFNDGSGVLYIKKMDFGRDGNGGVNGFLLSSNSLTVPPGGSARIEIAFKPTTAKDYTSQLCFVTNETASASVLTACQVVRSIGGGLYLPSASSAVVLSGVGI